MTDSELRKHQYFSQSIDQAIRLANREVLHPITDPLTQDKIMSVAIEIAKRRSLYIELVLNLGKDGHPPPSGDSLRTARIEFEEARDGFTALMTAIERNYIDVPQS